MYLSILEQLIIVKFVVDTTIGNGKDSELVKLMLRSINDTQQTKVNTTNTNQSQTIEVSRLTKMLTIKGWKKIFHLTCTVYKWCNYGDVVMDIC